MIDIVRSVRGSGRRGAGLAAVVAALVAVVLAAPVAAQGGDGYLFKTPRVTLEFETGYVFNRAAGDLFDDIVRVYTVGRRDFDSPYLGGEIGVRVSEHWDVTLGIGFQSSSVDSEYWDFIGTDDLPILQTTDFGVVTAVAGAKYFPLERGRSIGRFAWIPRKVAPFFAGGIGVASYSLEQYGEFIDFTTDEIYYDTLRSDRDGFLARLGAGVNLSLGKQFMFTAESRYSWSSAAVGDSYADYGDIDLGGLQLVGGIAVRF